MNRLDKAIKGGDPVNITTTIHEVRIQSIISYLQCHVNEEMDGNILNLLLTRLPVWYAEDYRHVPNYVKIVTLANLDNLEVILAHPTFSPPPIINHYINASSVAFWMLLASPKFGSDGETLECLLRHNHPDKIIAYLASNKVIIPSPEKIAHLATSFSCHRYSLSLILSDPRFDLAKVEMAFIKRCVDGNETILLDVLKVRLPDKINPLLAKKQEQERMRELHRPNLFK